MISSAIWIYFRRLKDYALLQRGSVISVLLVMVWIYAFDNEPLVLPIGLGIMALYSLFLYN